MKQFYMTFTGNETIFSIIDDNDDERAMFHLTIFRSSLKDLCVITLHEISEETCMETCVTYKGGSAKFNPVIDGVEYQVTVDGYDEREIYTVSVK